MKYFLIISFIVLSFIQLSAQNHYDRFESIDIQNYIFEIHLNDTTNRIEGKTNIKIRFLKQSQKLILDLIGRNDSTNTGMEVTRVSFKGNPVKFSHQNNQLEIDLNQIIKAREIADFEIEYAGIPADGLIISKNKFGDRTFFGDNWPDRARHWLPTVDHPSDKATLEFRVTAPEKYQVVSNGFQLEESNLDNQQKLTVWKENVPVSTKIMVIGVARFAVLENENDNDVSVSSWVFPQNREKGFADYSIGDIPLKYFSDLIGPYSYEKLAHVQSNTRYGGMENAGCIFYAENSVTGKKKAESLIAHETAHQWFGNSVTEQNWHHVWLSEGFATYLTHLYTRNSLGEEIFRQGLIKDREMVIRYAKRKIAPIIDTTITNYNQLLNTNSYQKAGWFLHMLHEKLGNEVFFKTLKEYYRIYKDSTALTSDFQKVTENISGQKLDSFFYQWLYQPGFPKLKTEWKQRKNMEFNLEISQVQKDYLFTFPLEIEILFSNGNKMVKTLEVKNWKSEFKISVNEKVESIQFDPTVKLLFDVVQ